MVSGNYNLYSYPYQQSSTQQYSGYQTAPTSSNISQSSRQYRPGSPVVKTLSTDCMPYSAQSYGGQGNAHAGRQGNSLGESNYGANRESTNRAAEVLRNMSTAPYSSNNSPAASQPTFTVTNAATSSPKRYSTVAGQATQDHATQLSYEQTQDRPRSVNTDRAQTSMPNRGSPSPATLAGHPSQRALNMYNQQERPESPAQRQYAHGIAEPASSARDTAMTAADQYNYYSNRQLPNIDSSHDMQSTAVSNSYSYANHQPTASIASSAPASSVPEPYNPDTITVDPMAIYDPWPQYQRKQEALRAQKAVEDAARAEEERKAEEVCKAEEAERRRLEEEKAKQTQAAGQRVNRAQKQHPDAASPTSGNNPPANESAALEAEIRAMMAKMRELNGRDPTLLAKIWEEERRTKAPKSPTVQTKPTPQPAAAQAAAVAAPRTANQAEKATSKESSSTAIAKSATPMPQPAVTRATAHAATTTSRPGTTIWPPEKKAQLASAAATYLSAHNPNNLLTSDQVLCMLDGNPSYIDLCEQLEAMGLTLDRAAFAKSLLNAVPDVNSASRKTSTLQPSHVNGAAAQRVQATPLAVMKRDIGIPSTPNLGPTAASPMSRPAYPESTDNSVQASHPPMPVTEMIPIKAELKPPASKEEAARKRDFNELIDLTKFSEDEDLGPPSKKVNVESMDSYGSPTPKFQNIMDIDGVKLTPPTYSPALALSPVNELRYQKIVEPLDRQKALRRNTYNVKTIARDVLLACGRHPEARPLNQHLETLKTTLPQVTGDSDLSTLRWDLIDPGGPPQGYFKDGVHVLAEDADDEDESNGEDDGNATRGRSTQLIGGEGATIARVQLPEPSNPFKQKRRGRPPRHSLPNPTSPSTPQRTPTSVKMSASAPHPAVAGVGYSAFRSATEYGPDGKPLPKKRGRPIGWRKAIHGSAATRMRPGANSNIGPHQHVPAQPSTLRNETTGGHEPIRINSRSPTVSRRAPQYQSFKCKWRNCKAELHNLETLKKHVYKVHRKESSKGFLECLWDDCGTLVAGYDQLTNMRIEQHTPSSFITGDEWRDHIQANHFDPLSWELGDGPTSGLSDAHDSEAYLSDAQGRRLTPRVITESERYESDSGPGVYSASANRPLAPRRRGRPVKNSQEQEARDAQNRFVFQKKRVGGPGMDRGGATLVNEKRRKGFSDNDETEEELVDVEE